MALHRAATSPPLDDVLTQPAPDVRCDRSHVERAHWTLTSPTSGLVITLCRYHYRLNQIALAVAGWKAEERIEA